MEFKPTPLDGVIEIAARPFNDDRGRFVKLFNEDTFRAAGLPTHFAEHYYSASKKGVVRGMHFQFPPRAQGKLVACAVGKVLDVALDLRADSPTYGRAYGVELEDVTGKMLYIPAGFGHGFCALTDLAVVVYSSTDVYDAKLDAAVRWDSFDFSWPVSAPIVSAKDAGAPALGDFKSPFLR